MEDPDKLKQDLAIVEMMAAEMEEYLRSDVLFWPMQRGDFPRLTLGGFLMRRHRLLALENLLDVGERRRLAQAMDTYRIALAGGVVRFEDRANEELDVRLRQWERFLSSRQDGEGGSVAYYAASVETRVMLTALVDELETGPYQLPARAIDKLALLDRQLRANWREGAFIWPAAWRPAYPPDDYWWLYGLPA